MRRVSVPSLVLLTSIVAACSGDDGASPTDTVPGTGTTLPEPPPDTGWPAGDVGNFHIAHHVNTGRTEVFVTALESDPGFHNFAQCGIAQTVCIGGFPPDEDTSRDFDPDQDLDRDMVTTRYLGYEISVGPYVMEYREDPDDGFGFYYLDGSDIGYAEGWVGASWGGQWPEYNSTDDLYLPKPIELINPRPGGFLEFTNGETAVIEWVPTGEGEVTLAVVPKFGDGKLYRLEDDGYFGLFADDLGLSGDVEELTFVLQRWTENEVSRFGHVVRMMASSDIVFDGQLLNIGGRDEIEPSDHCDQAQGGPALEAGFYWGFLGRGLTNDVDPNNGCLGSSFYSDANGVDGLFRIEVKPHHNVSVDYNAFTQSASVYFLEDCNDEDTCFMGSDLYPDPNIHEYIAYFNPDNETKNIYLGVDATDPGPESVFTLDVMIEELLTPEAHDFCADAQADTTPEYAGNYYADFVGGFTNQLNPGTGGCTGSSLPGPESLIPVELPSMATLDVSVDMAGADVGVYLLLDCNNAFSCVSGSDLSFSDPEGVSYQNTTNYPQTVYIVVDSKAGLAPYFLNISY
jgi:hypothetical protein